MAYKLVRLNSVLALTARSRSAHYVDIKDGLFTPPVKIGGRAVAWPQNEVDEINAARVAGKSKSEIRELVCGLVAKRTDTHESESEAPALRI